MGKEEDALIQWFRQFNQRYCQCDIVDSFLICLLTISLFFPPFYCVGPALAVIVRFFYKKEIFIQAMKLPGAKALMAFGVLLLLVTFVRGTGFNRVVAGGVVICLLLCLYFRQVMTLPLFHTCLDLFCAGGAITGLYGLIEKLINYGVAGFRGPSVFLNPNYFALMMVFTCICAVVQLVQSNHWYLYAIVLCLGLSGIIMADGRAALITAAICSLLALLLLKQWRLTIILILLTVILVPLLMTIFPNMFIRLEGVSVSADFEHRILIWKAAVKGFLQAPVFGQGAWMFEKIGVPFYAGLYEVHAHNLFFEILLMSGVVGTTLIAGYVLILVRDLTRMYRLKHVALFAVPGICTLCAVTLHGMLDVAVLFPQTGIAMFLLVSCIGIYDKLSPEEKERFSDKPLKIIDRVIFP